MKNGDNNQEVLPPEAPGKPDDVQVTDINLVSGKDPNKIVLKTPGQVKSEMGRIYRAVLKGRLSAEVGRVLVRDHLTPILKATEIEQQFNLAADDPDDDTPAMTGLLISGPKTAPMDGAPARSLDGSDNSTHQQPETERKTNEQQKETDIEGGPDAGSEPADG